MENPIITIENKAGEKFLRKRMPNFDFSKHTKKELRDLITRMKLIMQEANGIGLSGNQVGLEYRVFIAKPEKKMYAVFNPEIIKESKEKSDMEEGCLSVPLSYGEVTRVEKITVKGQDINGKEVKYKLNGLLARVFQHEIDHLNGTLFIDKAREIHKVELK